MNLSFLDHPFLQKYLRPAQIAVLVVIIAALFLDIVGVWDDSFALITPLFAVHQLLNAAGEKDKTSRIAAVHLIAALLFVILAVLYWIAM